jgi:hypothetical protein
MNSRSLYPVMSCSDSVEHVELPGQQPDDMSLTKKRSAPDSDESTLKQTKVGNLRYKY